MTVELMAALYSELAEALAPPSPLNTDEAGVGFERLAAPGREWPLFELAVQLAAQQPTDALAQAVTELAEVPASSSATRRAEYETLFVGAGRPPIWLYESQHVHGRLLGSAAFVVRALYEQAGLEIEGAELPDHAALELEFLAFLAEQEAGSAGEQLREWRAVRRLFIKKHAGRWLPQVGMALVASPYPAWAAIGRLLVAMLSNGGAARKTQPAALGLPRVSVAAQCNLCGFCVQVCPTRALQMREDDHATALWLALNLCVRCKKCVRVCEEQALAMTGERPEQAAMLLRESPRVTCPGCGQPTISRAEMEAVTARIGHPDWLDYCLDCRPSLLQNV